MKMDNLIRENELELFNESLTNSLTFDTQNILHTIDYLNLSQAKTKKRIPTCLHFCEALLMEILCNIAPENKLWSKVKYAAFLLNLANRNVKFDLLYKIFYQIEDCVQLKNLAWNSEKISDEFSNIVIENLFVKQDVEDIKHINKAETFDANESETYEDAAFDLFNGVAADYTQEENGDNYAAQYFKEDMVEGSYDPAHFLDYNVYDDYIKEGDSLKVKEEKLPKKRKRNPNNKRKKFLKVDDGIGDNQDGYEAGVKTSSEIIGEKVPKKRKRGPYNKRKKVDYGIEADGKTKDTDGKEMKGKYHFCKEHDCNYKTATNCDLEQHIFKVHESNRLCLQCGHLSDSYKNYIQHKETHTFTCDICNKVCLGAKSLTYHKTSIHGKNAKKQENSNEFNEDTNRVPCNICGVLMLKVCLEAHISQVHSTEVHKCDVCDFTANTKSKVTVHRKNHFNEILKCPECHKAMKGTKSLKRHFAHTCPMRKNKQVFDCNLCDKKFQTKVSLEKHIKCVHQKIKDIQCQLCDYQTYSNFNLRIHESKSHTKEDMTRTCLICEQKTMSLDHHMKTYHFDAYLKKKDLD